MRLPTTVSTGLTTKEGKAFGFEQTAEAFQLLSSTLYSNKPRAIIRELACNALDAHVAAGHGERPFEVKIPNKLDAQFHIKDFGPGLSHDDVLKLYTTYFKSTKQASNDFIGGFGVGSKSPFAYTDAFTVESRFEGKKRLYSAFLNAAGIPEMSLMLEMDSDEPSGLTVGFPVKATDFETFQREANQVLTVFPVPPVMSGMVLQQPDRSNIIVETPSVTLRTLDRHRAAGASVVVGAVEYPIAKYNSYLGTKTPSWLDWLVKQNLQVKVPVGTLSVAVSREDLAYDEDTLNALPGILKQALFEILDAFNDTTLSSEKRARLTSALHMAGPDRLQQWLPLFDAEKMTAAREALLGHQLFDDLPSVSAIVVDATTLKTIYSIPKHKFGSVHANYPLYEHALRYKVAPALRSAWRQLESSHVHVTADTTFAMMDLPSIDLPSQMLALETVRPQLQNNNQTLVLLVPSGTRPTKASFLEEARETLERWKKSGQDLTANWRNALVAHSGLKNKNPRQTGSSGNTNIENTKKQAGSRRMNHDWCVALRLIDSETSRIDGWLQRIKLGADTSKMKLRNWQSLPTMPDYLETEPAWFIVYDNDTQTFDGIDSHRFGMLLRSAVSDLQLPLHHVVVVPKDSENIKRDNWSPFLSAWLEHYRARKFSSPHSHALEKYRKLHLRLADIPAWQSSTLGAKLESFANDDHGQVPTHALRIATSALTDVHGIQFDMTDGDALFEHIEASYPMLAFVANDLASRHEIHPAVNAHIVEYTQSIECASGPTP